MSDNLCQDGLGLVSKGIIRCLISVPRELEWLVELPFEVQLQAHWNLVTGESEWPMIVSYKEISERRRFTHISFVGISN